MLLIRLSLYTLTYFHGCDTHNFLGAYLLYVVIPPPPPHSSSICHMLATHAQGNQLNQWANQLIREQVS
jgi:hypothetical protein